MNNSGLPTASPLMPCHLFALQFISQVQRLVKLAGEAYIDPADLKRVRQLLLLATNLRCSGPGCSRLHVQHWKRACLLRSNAQSQSTAVARLQHVPKLMRPNAFLHGIDLMLLVCMNRFGTWARAPSRRWWSAR